MSALTADKVYDQIGVYQAAIDRDSTDLKLLLHPRTDAVISASNQAALRRPCEVDKRRWCVGLDKDIRLLPSKRCRNIDLNV